VTIPIRENPLIEIEKEAETTRTDLEINSTVLMTGMIRIETDQEKVRQKESLKANKNNQETLNNKARNNRKAVHSRY